MSNSREEIDRMATELKELCWYIDVREDERGPFILAFAADDVHSLELWKADGSYKLELWHGKVAEDETVTSESSYPESTVAVQEALEWLKRGAT